MQKMSTIEFRNSLSDQLVQTFRMLNIAFITGVTFFGGVVLYLRSSMEAAGSSDDTAVVMLSMINAVLFPVFLLMSHRIPLRMLVTFSLTASGPITAATAISRIRSFMIMRIALLEAPALFGLVTVVVAILNGSLAGRPMLLCNMIPAAVMITILVIYMPSKERLCSWYETIR